MKEILDRCQKKGSIIIYGAGTIGKCVLFVFKKKQFG